MYVIGSYKTLASSAETILMKYAHHRYYMLGQTNQTFTFLSSLVTRHGLHQKRHASSKVSLNLRSALKLSTEQSFLWCIVWVALLHVSHNLQQHDYWKQFGIIFIVLFGLKVYAVKLLYLKIFGIMLLSEIKSSVRSLFKFICLYFNFTFNFISWLCKTFTWFQKQIYEQNIFEKI